MAPLYPVPRETRKASWGKALEQIPDRSGSAWQSASLATMARCLAQVPRRYGQTGELLGKTAAVLSLWMAVNFPPQAVKVLRTDAHHSDLAQMSFARKT